MKKRLVSLKLYLVLILPFNIWANEPTKIVTIDSATPTEALIAKPGTYLGEKFIFEQKHADETLVRVGVWEAGIGKLAIRNFPFTEYVLMISGVVVITEQNGESTEFRAGDTFVIPKGWSGEWDVKERMKKQIVRIGDARLMKNGAALH